MSTDWENQLILARFHVDMRLPGAEDAYRAWDNQTNQAVILHILPETTAETRSQLETRIRDLERVTHPGILPYLGLFELSGQAFWVEGYVDGPTLRFVLNAAAGQPLPLGEALIYTKSIAVELDALHALGWVHTSVSPETIRLGRNGAIYLSGLFTAEHVGNAPLAPETEIFNASDISALARLFYEMLAGGLPNEQPLPDLRKLNPDVPEFLARSLPRALDAHSEMRIMNANELFLTVCMASQIDPNAIPEKIRTTPDASSPSARLIETWNYLPPITPPPAAAKALERESHRPSPWLWILAAVLMLGAALVAWYLFSGKTGTPVLPTPVNTDAVLLAPLPTNLPSPTPGSLALTTDTPVPTVNAPEGLGGKIIFTCTRGELNQLCMVSPTGKGDVIRVTADSAHDFYPTFSPDGGLILFASNRNRGYDLYLKVLNGDILTQLTDGLGEVSSASFSPDGQQVAFSNSVNGGTSALWIVDKDGKNAHMLYAGTGGNVVSPAWSPNGQSIAFAMSSATALQTYEIFMLDLTTNDVVPITKGHLADTGGSVDWSPDGRSLLLFAGKPGDNNIYSLEIVTGVIRKLTDGGNNAAPSYSPDGQWIVFNSMRAGDNANIFIMRPDGSDVRQLTNDTEPDWQPRWGR